MSNPQNIYDNSNFFGEYQSMRHSKINANELIEIPTIKSMIEEIEGKRVLDLGCGDGGMSRYFAKQGAQSVLGLDISTNMIEEAKKLTNYKNVKYRVLGMEQLSTVKGKYDIVFSSLAFHYVKNYNKLIKDIAKLLVPNGILVFSTEHPITTAPILKNGAEKYITVKGKRYYLYSDYNNVGKRHMLWNGEKVEKYHRNIETLVGGILKAGLMLTDLQESKASKEAIQLVPKYKYQNDRPYYLFIKAKKIQ